MANAHNSTNKHMVKVDNTAFVPKVKPPKGMTKEGKAEWRLLIEMIPNENIIPSDYPLMEDYCETIVQFRLALHQITAEGAVIDGTLNPATTWMDKCSSRIAMLATKLRLAPNARKELANTHGKAQESVATTPLGKLLNG